MTKVRGRVLIAGSAAGRLVRLAQPISFWGGVDPATGRINDPRHPNHGTAIHGRVLAVPAMIGSSSSSAVMLELLRNQKAPAAVLLGAADAILALGVVVAREMGYPTIPVVELARRDLDRLADDGEIRVAPDGTVSQGMGGDGRGR